MKDIFIILFVILAPAVVAGQQMTVTGVVADEAGNGLPSATVMLLNPQDSSLANFTAADAAGKFEIRNIRREPWLLKVTFIGYHPAMVAVDTAEDGVQDVGTITMQPKSTELDNVTIEGEHIPVTVKKDTIEFNARAFKTPQNAMVEDLLKRLPGMEVNNDGDITAQGERVQRVTVDGKEFFGRDPKLATRNLPADAVEKVQVVDGKSEQARFTGIDDGKREKTINLELKEDRKNGVFGQAMAGAGTDDRFEGRTSLNRFTKSSRLSLLGMANNTNQQGFSMNEYMNFTGAASQLMGGGGGRVMINANSGIPLNPGGNGGNGLMTTAAGGINLNKNLTEGLEVNGSWFANHLDHDISQSLQRETFQAERQNNFMYLQENVQENISSSQRGNLRLDYSIDSLNSLQFNGNISVSNTTANAAGISRTLKADGTLQNESTQQSTTTGGSLNTDGNLLYRHKFGKKGRTFSADTEFAWQNNDSDGKLDAVNSFYGPSASEMVLDQESSQRTEGSTLGSTVSYTEPLGGRKYLEARYSIRHTRNELDRQVFDLENEQRFLNTDLSNIYSSDYLYQRTGINFRFNQRKYNITLGAGHQDTRLKGELQLQNATIRQRFNNILPVARFNYEFTSSKRMSIDYETSVQEPTIRQLQPVADNSNPLDIYEGNPNLQPEYRHNLFANFTSFNPMKFLGFFSFLEITYTDHAITNAQRTDEQFVRYTRPENTDNALRVAVNANLSMPLQFIKSRINIGASAEDNYSVTILNDVESNIRQTSASANIRYSYSYKEVLDISLSGSTNRQLSDYELNQPDQAFVNSTYTAEVNYSFLKHYQLQGSYSYMNYSNEKLGFGEDLSMLNVSVSRTFLKNNRGELKLSVLNLLDENAGVTQNAGLNYVEHQTTNTLGRYLMLSFTWSINKHLNPMGDRKGGIIIRR